MGVFCVITANSGMISSVFLHKTSVMGTQYISLIEMILIGTPQYIFRENYPKIILSSYAALSHSSNTILGT